MKDYEGEIFLASNANIYLTIDFIDFELSCV